VELKAPRRKNKHVTKGHKGPRTWSDSLDKRPKLRKMNMRSGAWNVRSLYKAVSLIRVAGEVAKYKLDLVGA
jgi:hypothetical protein